MFRHVHGSTRSPESKACPLHGVPSIPKPVVPKRRSVCGRVALARRASGAGDLPIGAPNSEFSGLCALHSALNVEGIAYARGSQDNRIPATYESLSCEFGVRMESVGAGTRNHLRERLSLSWYPDVRMATLCVALSLHARSAANSERLPLTK